MTRRSWYLDQASADELTEAVEALHHATRMPKHVVLAAVLRSGLDAVDGLRTGWPTQRAAAAEASHEATRTLPRYLTLVPREITLRGDQIDALAELRERLQTSHPDQSPELTDDALLRVAVDMLLAHADQLQGGTEEALAASVLGGGPSARRRADPPW